MTPKITLIVACDKKFAIGKDNTIPWNIPSDMAHFKRYTAGKVVVCGMNTFNSLPTLLAGRYMFVLSRQDDAITVLQEKASRYKEMKKTDVVPFCAHVQSVGDFFELFQEYFSGQDEICVIGGSQIYELFYPIADSIIMSMINTEIEDADTFLTPPNDDFWKISRTLLKDSKSDKDQYSYSIHEFTRSSSAQVISLKSKRRLSKMEIIKLIIDSK